MKNFWCLQLSLLALLFASGNFQFVLAESTIVSEPAKQGSNSSPYRLNPYIAPRRYELEFEPDPEKGRFQGAMRLEIDLSRTSREIVLNARDLKISGASLLPERSDTLMALPLQVSLYKDLERVVFRADSELAPGKYFLYCRFAGILNDDMVGFYRSRFKDKDGKVHYLAVTQMEPTDARRMFPCFDEPAFKAVFKIKVKVPQGQTAVSNAELERETVDKLNSKKTIEFKDSLPMSSYLLALLVGEFRPTEALESDGVKIRVWSTISHEPEMGNFARDNAGKLLRYLNSYFGIDYPWKKLDLIAIPDFKSGAMENPGAITFREKFLLADEKTASLSTKQDIVGITAHEMAHLWFGDLVTMQWWDDIWLNEAFATWMAKKAVDKVYPEWNAMSGFFANRLKAFQTDSLRSTRAIQAKVTKPEDALQMFDEITYVKGAAVLRMLEFYLGERVFQDGVSAYLKRFSYANARTDDLWDALARASGKPVKRIMDTWCKQPGYPLLSLDSEGKKGTPRLKQERFLLDGGKADRKQVWQVPLSWKELGAAKASSGTYKLLAKEQETWMPESASPVCLNSNAYGFYRYLCTENMSNRILSRLADLAPPERLCFLSDHEALAIAGKIPVQQYLRVLQAYNQESDFAVWECICDCLERLDRFVDTKSRPSFAKFVRTLLRPCYERLGWQKAPGESLSTSIVRSRVIEKLGSLAEDREVILKARELFAGYVKSGQGIDPDLLDAVTDIIAYNGGKQEFAEIKQLWKTAKTPEIEQRNLYALSAFRKKELIDAALRLTLSKEVRAQDGPKVLANFFTDNEAKIAAWNFMRANWPGIKKAFSVYMLSKLAEAPQSLVTRQNYNEAKSFFAANPIPDGKSGISRMLEKLEINVQFKEQRAPALNKWLRDNYQR